MNPTVTSHQIPQVMTDTDSSDQDGKLHSIGDLAAECGISPRTIRFYEDHGLISPARAGANRIYSHRDRARLKLILRGKRPGFALSEIKEFLDLYDLDPTQSRQLALMLERTRARIVELEQQQNDIAATLTELRDIEAQALDYQATTAQPGKRKSSNDRNGRSHRP